MDTNRKDLTQESIAIIESSARTMFLREVSSIVKGMPHWSKMSEHEQRRVLDQISSASTTLVKQMVEACAADGRKCVQVLVDTVKIKGGITVTLTAQQTPENIHDLGTAAGLQGYFVPVDASKQLETDVSLKADPDQPELVDVTEAMSTILPAADRIRITEGGKVNLIVQGTQMPLEDVEDDAELDALADAFGLDTDADVEDIILAIQEAVGDGSFVTYDKRIVDELDNGAVLTDDTTMKVLEADEAAG